MASLPFDEKKGCPDGFHKRISYTSKLGHRVPPRCVKSTTVYKESHKNFTRRVLAKQESRLKAIGKPGSLTRKCPPGMVERHGYVRRFGKTILKKGYTVKRASGDPYRIYPERSSVYVKPTCVKERGLHRSKKLSPGEGFGAIRRGELKKYGYVYNEPDHVRHEALNKAVKEFGALGVFHKLDAIAKLSKRTVPQASSVFRSDIRWLAAHYKLKAP